MSVDTTFLRKVILFKHLTDSQIERVIPILEVKRFAKGQMIFKEGDTANGVYILNRGKVKVFKLSPDGKEQVLHFITEGEIFGEVAAFLGEAFPANAESLSESIIYLLPRLPFLKLIQEDPQMALNIMALFAYRLKEFVRLIDSLALKNIAQRLSTYLLFIAEKKGNVVALDVKKSEIASFLGTIPETLSRVFSKMAKARLLKVRGNKIEILDPSGLEKIALGIFDLSQGDRTNLQL
ncbi:MAG: Crp/Fnr family transcriptional regulator [Desulfobacterota bacterium]|nr:Crp/Fnr family transcriptional regulator [Thermodesulfobacteriota bacterium]MDW8001561.1 Crp/Fnr family transcriptional regulator [Deltaproteobacteria bacterium]